MIKNKNISNFTLTLLASMQEGRNGWWNLRDNEEEREDGPPQAVEQQQHRKRRGHRQRPLLPTGRQVARLLFSVSKLLGVV
jgi:hypothetical protein